MDRQEKYLRLRIIHEQLEALTTDEDISYYDDDIREIEKMTLRALVRLGELVTQDETTRILKERFLSRPGER